jgi:hypothetical protein
MTGCSHAGDTLDDHHLVLNYPQRLDALDNQVRTDGPFLIPCAVRLCVWCVHGGLAKPTLDSLASRRNSGPSFIDW